MSTEDFPSFIQITYLLLLQMNRQNAAMKQDNIYRLRCNLASWSFLESLTDDETSSSTAATSWLT